MNWDWRASRARKTRASCGPGSRVRWGRTFDIAPDTLPQVLADLGPGPQCLRSEDIIGQLVGIQHDEFGLAEESLVLLVAGRLVIFHDLSQLQECCAGRLALCEPVLSHRQEG